MKKLLLLFASLTLIAPAANAERYWLIITSSKVTVGYAFEKIEMESITQCQEQGRIWKSRGKYSNLPEKLNINSYPAHGNWKCLIGK
jgi:uncharacterized GH25 family protein